ncbi:MAG: DUF6191 domain-containing protein [Actinomycetes bacterium]
MGAVFTMTLPGLVVLLFLVAAADQVLLRVRGRGLVRWRRDSQVSSTGFDLLHAALSPGKEAELDQRRTELVLRAEDEDGAPPLRAIDLDGGIAHLHVPPRPAADRDRPGQQAR